MLQIIHDYVYAIITYSGCCGYIFDGQGRKGNTWNMWKYKRIVYWSDEEQKWIVEVPELPGCMVDGTSVVDALIQSEEVIKDWLETAEQIERNKLANKKRKNDKDYEERMEIIEDPYEGGYIVSYPELTGCITSGETLESAITNAKDAKITWLSARAYQLAEENTRKNVDGRVVIGKDDEWINEKEWDELYHMLKPNS